MVDQDMRDRLTRVEERLTERSREAEMFRAEVKASLRFLAEQQTAVVSQMGKLTAQFEAHLMEDRRILQRVNGNHRQERLVNIGLGAGSGGGIATIIVAVGRGLGWW